MGICLFFPSIILFKLYKFVRIVYTLHPTNRIEVFDHAVLCVLYCLYIRMSWNCFGGECGREYLVTSTRGKIPAARIKPPLN